MGRLDTKVAVITGAASGIGRAAAIRFAQEGASLVLADLNARDGETVANDCRKAGARAVFESCDVAIEADIKRVIARAVTEFARLDVMMNNAGLLGPAGAIEQIELEQWDSSMAILARAVALGMKHSVPELRKVGGGAIISTASVAGMRGGIGPHAYSAAKAAVISLTRTVALEVGKDRIRVNCICPGYVNTPLITNNMDMPQGVRGSSAPADMAPFVFASKQPIARMGTPRDIANVALYLASDESDWVTGSAVVVDGGLAAGAAFQQL